MRRAACASAIVLSILAAGCTSHGARDAPAPQAVAPPADDGTRGHLLAAEALCQQVAADPQLAPLRGRILPRDPKVPWTRDMMMIASYADERDRPLLLALDGKRAACRRALIEASPGQAVPFLDYWRRQDDAMVKLYNREIPIGSYNRAMAEAQGQLTIDVSNQNADRAVRANQPHDTVSPADRPAARGTAAASLDSFRALGARP